MAWNMPLVVEEQLIELGGMRQKESSPMALVLEKAATGGNQHPSHPGGLGVGWNRGSVPCLSNWLEAGDSRTVPVSSCSMSHGKKERLYQKYESQLCFLK